MDPNRTLKQIRDITERIDSGDIGSAHDDLIDLHELIASLDTWLSKGGALPKDWCNNNDDGFPRRM